MTPEAAYEAPFHGTADDWNRSYPVGTRVRWKPARPELVSITSRTSSAAETIGMYEHPCVRLAEGDPDAWYSLHAITPLDPEVRDGDAPSALAADLARSAAVRPIPLTDEQRAMILDEARASAREIAKTVRVRLQLQLAELDDQLHAAEYAQLIRVRRRLEPRRPHLPRFLHRWYAGLFGYFWLPCPLCLEPFGGHEVIEPEALGPVEIRIGRKTRILCPRCVRDGAR